MNYEQILTTVLASIGTAGGLASIVTIVCTLIKANSSRKHSKALRENTKAIIAETDKVCQTVKDQLECAVEVDVSAKIQPIADELRMKYADAIDNLAAQVEALKKLELECAKVLVKSSRLTETERKNVTSVIDYCKETLDDKPAKGKIILSIKEKAEDVIEKLPDVVEKAKEIASIIQV